MKASCEILTWNTFKVAKLYFFGYSYLVGKMLIIQVNKAKFMFYILDIQTYISV